MAYLDVIQRRQIVGLFQASIHRYIEAELEMCKTEVIVERNVCSITFCRKCIVYSLHIGPISFRLEENILADLSRMFDQYFYSKNKVKQDNQSLALKH